MSELNEQQQEAVRHGEGPMLVLAGPGSGKTTMITHRVLRLTQDLGILEKEIMVVTYTRAAAQEMRGRFLRLQGTDQTDVAFGTFHSLFWQMLREEGFLLDRGVMEEGEQQEMAAEILFRQGVTAEAEREELVGELLSRYNYRRNTGQERGEKPYEGEEAWRSAYEEGKRSRGKMDFDDILETMLQALGRQDIRRVYQNRYRYFLVDEFQDVNPVQYDILRILTGPGGNLFAVGDDDQAIYGFRGAAPGIMLRFPKDFPACQVLSLRRNYRSTPRIVKRAAGLIVQNQGRYPKEIVSVQKKLGPRIRRCVFEEEKEEYRAIAKEAARRKDMCLLFRTHSQMKPLLRSLEDYGVPYRTREGAYNPYTHWVGEDIAQYRKAALGDRKAFLEVLRRYKGGIPLACVSWLREGEEPRKLLEKAMSIELRTALLELFYELDHLRVESPEKGLHRIAGRLRYFRYLEGEGEKRGVDPAILRERFDFFWRRAEKYEDWEEWEAERRRRREEPDKEEKDGVLLLTMHAAKGLEFDTVWIPGIEEGTIPHERSEDIEEERRLLYVGCTRAKTRLILSRNRHRGGNGQTASPFWRELGEENRKNT